MALMAPKTSILGDKCRNSEFVKASTINSAVASNNLSSN